MISDLLMRLRRTWLAPMQHPRHDFSVADLHASVSQLSRNATTHDGPSMHNRPSLPMSLRKETVRSEQPPASLRWRSALLDCEGDCHS